MLPLATSNLAEVSQITEKQLNFKNQLNKQKIEGIRHKKIYTPKGDSNSQLYGRNHSDNLYGERVKNLLSQIDGEKYNDNKSSANQSINKFLHVTSPSSVNFRNKSTLISFHDEIDAKKQSLDSMLKKDRAINLSTSQIQFKKIATVGEIPNSRTNSNRQYFSSISDHSVSRKKLGSIGQVEELSFPQTNTEDKSSNFHNIDYEQYDYKISQEEIGLRSSSKGLRNIFTSCDSRFEVINQLKTKNIHQERIIEELKSEIAQVDEFKIVLNASINGTKSEDDANAKMFADKRLLLLKAQLKKQQRYIRQLTSLLTASRKSFTEILDLCKLLMDGVTKSSKQSSILQKVISIDTIDQLNQISLRQQQQQIQQKNESKAKTPVNQRKSPLKQSMNEKTMTNQQPRLTNDNQNQEEIKKQENQPKSNNKNSQEIQTQSNEQDQKVEDEPYLKKNDIGTLLNQMTQQQAIQKLFEFLIDVDDKHKFVSNFNEAYSKVQQFECNNQEFKKLFQLQKNKVTQKWGIKFLHPLRQVLDKFPQCFPISTLYEILDPQSKQTIQSRIFGLMEAIRSTNRHFKRIRTFSLFLNNPLYFRNSEAEGNGNITISPLLLENEKSFEEFMQQRGCTRMISLNFQKIMETDSTLGQLLDKLLIFYSSLYEKGETTKEMVEIIHLIRKSCEDLISLGIVVPGELGNVTSQKIVYLMDKSQNKHDSSIEWVNYDKCMGMHSDFNEIRVSLSSLFEELNSSINTKETQEIQFISQKIGNVMDSLSTVFEVKESQIRLKTAEIEYLRNIYDLKNQEEGFVNDFIDQLQIQIKELLTPINEKMNQIVTAFNNLFEQKSNDQVNRQNYSRMFRRNSKELLELIKRILSSTCPSNKINILTLKQQFNSRVQTVLSKQAHIKPQKRRISQTEMKSTINSYY